MATLSITFPRHTYRAFRFPRIYIEIQRKDLWICAIIFLTGLAIPILMALEILPLSMLLGFIGFGLTFTSGTLFLVRLGEIA